ncbi:MAG: hypothetical protein U5J83_17775 [Bryobacterales bacterium]|nr:hypothetical protein [Bryobacterales bacterium]
MPLTAELGEEWYPTFSPDATEVGYIWRNANGDTDIYRRSIENGTVMPLTFDRKEKHCLSWSPDGRTLAFCRELEPNRSAIILLTVGDAAERELTTGFIPRDLDMGETVAWSPDGRFIIASIDRKWSAAPGLHRIQVDSGESIRLHPATGRHLLR